MLFELSKAWFNHDFPAPPAMSRVTGRVGG
jgi:hypothetical protein